MNRSRIRSRLLLCALLFVFTQPLFAQQTGCEEPERYDIVIYGGTSAGVIAAVQAARDGHSVVLIEPRQHLGGLTVSGLGWTDSGNKSVIGGLSREFYRRVKEHYDDPASWKHEDRDAYDRYRENDDSMWTFEPHVAENILNQMLGETDAKVVLGEALDREDGVVVEDGRIESIRMLSGRCFAGKRFIDATYEGDLMAAAGVSFTVGREPNKLYDETLNGVQKARTTKHQFVRPVDPYVVAGDATSGLLPGISMKPGEDGEGDHRVQAYNYRICMTPVDENKVPFAKPADYEPALYELLLRNFAAGDDRLPLKIDMMPNLKTDVNNNHAVSTDFIGMNYDFPEASYAEREEIRARHESYVRGLLWTLAYHPDVPEQIRQEVSRWGLAKDEFVDNDNWPYWPYIREARRMVADYVQTEHDCRRTRMCDDPVGLGSYNMDSHNCQRYVTDEGYVRNEGDIQVSPGGPYLISYRAIVPAESECQNLLVPVCLSASHIAYGSIRMEPVFMILGQSAALAADLSIENDQPVQDVEYEQLRERLLAEDQVIAIPEGSISPKGLPAKMLKGIVIDDTQAEKIGDWSPSRSVGGFVGDSYLHDDNAAATGVTKMVRFPIRVQRSGSYEVRLSYAANPNRATNVPVILESADGRTARTINQKQTPPIDKMFVTLGEYEFSADRPGSLTISNEDADGHVIADAVQLIAVE